MRFLVENNVASKVVATLSKVNTTKENVSLNILFGIDDRGAYVQCVSRLTTSADQVQVSFQAKKPEGFVVAPENIVNLNVSATKFLAIMQMTLSYKSDIFFDVEGSQVVIGVEGRCKTPLALEGAGKTPIAQSKILFRARVTANNLTKLIREGLAFTSGDASFGYGTIVVMQQGLLVGYSTDGKIFARTMVEADFEQTSTDPQIVGLHEMCKKNLAEVVAANGKDANMYPISLPVAAIGHLKELISGDKVDLYIDDLHIHAQLDADTIYTASLSAKDLAVKALDAAFEGEVSTQIGVDSQTLATGVEYINSIAAVTGNANKFPILLRPVAGAEGKLVLTSDAISDLESVVKPTKVSGNDAFAVNGKYLSDALRALSKGGIVVSVLNTKGNRQPVILNNGTTEAVDTSSSIGMLQVNLKVNREAEGSDKEEAEATEE